IVRVNEVEPVLATGLLLAGPRILCPPSAHEVEKAVLVSRPGEARHSFGDGLKTALTFAQSRLALDPLGHIVALNEDTRDPTFDVRDGLVNQINEPLLCGAVRLPLQGDRQVSAH